MLGSGIVRDCLSMATPDPVTPQPARSPVRPWLLLAAAGAVRIAFGRALTYAAGRGYLDEDSLGFLPRVLSRRTVETLPLALLLFLGMGLAALILRRNRFGTRVVAPLAGLYAFLAWGHLTLRLPVELHAHPGFESARGIIANAGAALAALALSALLFLPLLAARGGLGPGAIGLVLKLSRWVRRCCLLVVVPVLALWLWPLMGGSKADSRPNLILISIDTLRADHVGAYGHDAGTTPALDAFAAEAVRFEGAFSHHPWTLTAHATMLTGLHPSAHRVDRDRALSPRLPTLAGLLQDEGYTTFAVADDNQWLNARYGFARGFQRYRQLPGGAERKAQEILDELEDWIEGPFFLFAHFYDVHSDWDRLPYDAERIDLERLAGWYQGDWDGCGGERGCASRLLADMNDAGDVLDEPERRYLRDLYDAGVATFDRKLAVLLDGLEAAGRFDDSIIVITADHGEEFFEHGKALHGQHYDECLRVPFLVRLPGGENGGLVVEDLVGLVDVTPTLLEAAGLDPSEALVGTQGRSVLPLTQGEPVEPRAGILMDSGSGVFGLRTRDHAVIHGASSWELYDLSEDPGQANGIPPAELDPEVFEHLRQRLKDLREEALAFGEAYDDGEDLGELDADQAARMADLGYLGDDEPGDVGEL